MQTLGELPDNLRADRDVGAAVATMFCDMPEDCRADRATVLAAVRVAGGSAFASASIGLRADKEVVLAAIALDANALSYAAEPLRSDKDCLSAVTASKRKIWLNEVRRCPVFTVTGTLRSLPEEARSDRQVVLAAVRKAGLAVQHASEDLRADPELMLIAVRLNAESVQFAAGKAAASRDVFLAAVAADGELLQFASLPLRGDADLGARAAEQSPEILGRDWFPESLRADWKVVHAAVRQSGKLLQHASKSLRGDRALAIAAVKNNAEALRHVPEPLRSDPELGLLAVQRNPYIMGQQFFPAALKANQQVVLQAVRANADILQYAAEPLFEDEKIGIEAVSHDPLIMSRDWFPASLKANRQVVLAAVSRNSSALQFADKGLRADKEVVLAAVANDVHAVNHVDFS